MLETNVNTQFSKTTNPERCILYAMKSAYLQNSNA